LFFQNEFREGTYTPLWGVSALEIHFLFSRNEFRENTYTPPLGIAWALAVGKKSWAGRRFFKNSPQPNEV
jgi:hypothetical protein